MATAPLLARQTPTAAMPCGFAAALAVGLSMGWLAPRNATAAEAAGPGLAATCPALLQHTLPRLQDDKPQALCQYAGRVLLVVNTASQCGFTPQFKGLETLAARYRARGFEVLGFPSNDFQQEAGSNRQIADFCENQFGVRFPLFAKGSVRGPHAAPFYRGLMTQTGQAPAWNFHKYLVGRNGRVVAQFDSAVTPDNPALLRAIDTQLARPAASR